MFTGLIAFCLSRRPIIIMGLMLFAGTGFVAFKKLNIEAYPNPAPVILVGPVMLLPALELIFLEKIKVTEGASLEA